MDARNQPAFSWPLASRGEMNISIHFVRDHPVHRVTADGFLANQIGQLLVMCFPVAVHPNEPDTAWFVPAMKDEERIPVDGQLVVTRTRDGGATFDVLREGLPQEHAYDIVYRHCLDIDASGDRLAFGSTTGSLWVTENQGDAWQHVSAHLPPIYCVRFA